MASNRVIILVAVMILLAAGVVASADVVVAESIDTLTGDGTVGSIECKATVTRGADNIYTYLYELTYTTGTSAVHTFSLGNPNCVDFYDANNIFVIGAKTFQDPEDGSDRFLEWTQGEVRPNDQHQFSYKSAYAPMLDVKGSASVIDGGCYAEGSTLVMGDVIPEPASLLVVLFGSAGVVPMILKRRK